MTPADPLAILKSIFGHTAFCGAQAEVVASVMADRHTLAVMPTGAGKSVCHQVPALALGGLGLVVSPLKALMRDQVRALTANSVRAAALSSDTSDPAAVIAAARAGALDLLYITPERAALPDFADQIRAAPLALIAIDEAHCISQWGDDFRPEYRQLRGFADRRFYPRAAGIGDRLRRDARPGGDGRRRAHPRWRRNSNAIIANWTRAGRMRHRAAPSPHQAASDQCRHLYLASSD